MGQRIYHPLKLYTPKAYPKFELRSRILVIGCPGAGKSTFSRKLAQKTGLPLYHLDLIWHKPDRTHISPEEFDYRLNEILKSSEWIIDGNYKRTLPVRLKRADTVFMFDLPVEVCLQGAIDRLGKDRPDIPWHDSELSDEFRQWIIDYPKDQMPAAYEALKSFHGNIFIFHTRDEADQFLASL